MSVDFTGLSNQESLDKLEELFNDGKLRDIGFAKAKQAAMDCGLGVFRSWDDLEVALGGAKGGGDMSVFSGLGRGNSGRGGKRDRTDDSFWFGMGRARGSDRGNDNKVRFGDRRERVVRNSGRDVVAVRSGDGGFGRGSMQAYLWRLYGDKDMISGAFSYDSETAVANTREICRKYTSCCRENNLDNDDAHELKAVIDALIEFVELVAANRTNTAWSRLSIRVRGLRRELEAMIYGTLERIWG